ncbi:alpha/beta fold hydrolase [Spongiibacter nanhainus]|nr:alpha/beta hydrolase [Spongiibacter nanhainus]
MTVMLRLIAISMLAWGSVALANSTSTAKSPSYDAQLSDYAYPFAVKTFQLRSQNQALQMAYMYLPAKGERKGVITLLHGKNFNGAYWQDSALFLSEQGFDVLMPDQIGFGKSSKPTDYQYSFAALANNTRALLDKLDIDKTWVLGHSMGGMLASRFALLYPKRTEQLILLNPIGLEDYLRYVEYKDIGFFYRNELKASAEGVLAYQRKNYYDGQWKEDYAALAEPLIGWIQGPDWKQLAQVSARAYDMIFTGPVINEFQHLAVPTTLILGTRDRTGPGRNWKRDGVTRELGRYDRLGAEVKARNPSIELIELKGLGHLPHIEDFATFAAALSNTLNPEK